VHRGELPSAAATAAAAAASAAAATLSAASAAALRAQSAYFFRKLRADFRRDPGVLQEQRALEKLPAVQTRAEQEMTVEERAGLSEKF
jgi:hypothetical protein